MLSESADCKGMGFNRGWFLSAAGVGGRYSCCVVCTGIALGGSRSLQLLAPCHARQDIEDKYYISMYLCTRCDKVVKYPKLSIDPLRVAGDSTIAIAEFLLVGACVEADDLCC